MARIVLFGATGYTGRLVARDLVRSGAAPLLVGRSSEALTALVEKLNDSAPGGRAATFEVADINRPASLRRLLHSPDDVVVSAVGPYARLGSVAVEAAIDAGCAYVDCSGEPAFLSSVFQDYGPKARRTGARLLPAMGFDFLPGNLAGGLLIHRYSDAGLTGLRLGYFVTGPFGPSSGSVASAAGIMLDPSFTFEGGKLHPERPGARVQDFLIDGNSVQGLSLGGSEVFALPRLDPDLRDIGVYVGWAGRWSRAAAAASSLAAGARQVPGVGSAMGAVFRTALGGASAEGPADHVRARSRSIVVAEGVDAEGAALGRVTVEGPNPYDLTAALLTWSARMLSRRADKAVGALGPIEAFGLDALVSGCLALGLAEAD